MVEILRDSEVNITELRERFVSGFRMQHQTPSTEECFDIENLTKKIISDYSPSSANLAILSDIKEKRYKGKRYVRCFSTSYLLK